MAHPESEDERVAPKRRWPVRLILVLLAILVLLFVLRYPTIF
ncbi:MAG TPA: hypothetical protein VGC10_04700 [Sphingomonas sp.]